MAEWVYRATTARRDLKDTSDLAHRHHFIARSAFSPKHKRIANVRQVAPGDVIHFFFREPSHRERRLLGSFRVRDGAVAAARFDRLEEDGALVAVREVPENQELLGLLWKAPASPESEGYAPDPVRGVITGWLVEPVALGAPPYDKSLFPGQGSLYLYTPPLPEIRKLLDQLLISSADFDAFVLDYFPQVERRYAAGMVRLRKQNLLLQEAQPGDVAAALELRDPERFFELLSLIRSSREEAVPRAEPDHPPSSRPSRAIPGTPIRDIFRTSGQPEHNFVEPAQAGELRMHLQTLGEGLVVEGPSGVGKTTAVDRALRELGVRAKTVWLSALSAQDWTALDNIVESDFQQGGYLVVDDFHRLDPARQKGLTSLIKLLSDRNRRDAKVTLIGVNPIGASLLSYFPDVFARFGRVQMREQPPERVTELVHRGEIVANVVFTHRRRFVDAAAGSFMIAQRLCLEAALQARIFEAAPERVEVKATPEMIIGKVQDDLAAKLNAHISAFAAWDAAPPPRGACLSLLWHLSRSHTASVSLHDVRYRDPRLTEAFNWLLASNLGRLFEENREIQKILHYDRGSAVLSAEDPQVDFYLRHLDWPRLARMTGHQVERWDPSDGPVFGPRSSRLEPAIATSPSFRAEAVAISSAQPTAAEPAARAARPAHLLHLSDLHFGTLADAVRWHSQLAEDLKSELSIPRLDAVLISGDIANRADPEEYLAAQRFFQEVMSEFGLSPQKIVLVPGNHDLSWPLSEKAYTPVRRKSYKGPLTSGMFIDAGDYVEVRGEAEYRERFRPFAELYQGVRMEPYPLDYSEQATVHHFPDQQIVVLGLNSAWMLDHHYRERAGINGDALSGALNHIRHNPAYASCLKLAVWHHPVAGSGEDRIKDTGFLERLVQAGFRFGLHGHVHRADNTLFRSYYGSRGGGIELLCAGTFGAPTHELVPGIPLQYQVIEVADRKLVVHTRRREERNGAWKPDARWPSGPRQDPKPRYEILIDPT